MQIKYFFPLWGHKHMTPTQFVNTALANGFDGIELNIPLDKKLAIEYIKIAKRKYLLVIAQQSKADGLSHTSYLKDLKKHLEYYALFEPVLINSHTGKDYFSFEQNLSAIEICLEFEYKKNIPVCHEIHRGRFTFNPYSIKNYLETFPNLLLCADFSHWICVTESFLQHSVQKKILNQICKNIIHLHARPGNTQALQVLDFRTQENKPLMDYYFDLWINSVECIKKNTKLGFVPITLEHGPMPYMQNTLPQHNTSESIIVLNTALMVLLKKIL